MHDIKMTFLFVKKNREKYWICSNDTDTFSHNPTQCKYVIN